MTKQFCKTYIKTIAKYKQVPPILNFLYGSFSTAWVIYLTEDHFYFHIYIHISKKKYNFGYASSQWPPLQLA